MHLQSITLRHDSFPTRDWYPFNLKVLQETGSIPLHPYITFFIGENGSGKSTLLRAIARRCGIHLWNGPDRVSSVRNPYEAALHHFIELEWSNGTVPGSYFASETFNNFAQVVDEWAKSDPGILEYYGGRTLVTQSHGQCTMSYFTNRFTRRGIYLLDEPETALSPRRQIELLTSLKKFKSLTEVQFIIATHSPILLAFPDAAIYSFDAAPIRKVLYEDTDYYTVYREFLGDRGKFL